MAPRIENLRKQKALRVKPKTVHFYGQLALTLMVSGFLVVPLVQSVLAGVTTNFFIGVRSGLTLRWVAEVWQLYSDTIFRSLGIGLACLALNLLIGIPAAYAMVKNRSRFMRVVEELLVIPLAVPGLAIALGILVSYGTWTAFRRSWVIILAGHLIFTLPFMIRSVMAVMASFNLDELEESAASLGAGFRARFFHIAVPNAVLGVLSGALMVFTLSIGEFNLTWMLHTPLTKTLPVGLADSYASMRLEIGAAYTLIFLLMIIPLLMAMQWAAASPQRVLAAAAGLKGMVKRPLTTWLRTEADLSAGGGRSDGSRSGTAVKLVGCAKTFPNGTRALAPVDLAVKAGETVVILGPSGCGKTTLLRIIAGLEQPDSGGEVHFDTENVTAVPIEKRNVGMVFQNYALFPNMTVAENILYGLKIRGDAPAKRARRLEEMVAMMKIGPLKDRRIHQLSGGQKQRVALARAIAIRPRILLLDEPLTALDAKLRDALRVEIDELLRSVGITSVYVTHDQGEAMALGDRIVVMDQGRVSQIGSPREIYFQPQSRFVAAFVGNLNRLPATVEGDGIRLMDTVVPRKDLPRLAREDRSDLELFFRPEHAALADKAAAHLSARVDGSVFMGDRTRLAVGNEAGTRFLVDVAGRRAFDAGATVHIRLALDEVFSLDE
jgi:putative spermidine/putrescine transport system ATP-binding protein